MTGKEIRKKRKELNLTQEELAKMLGISTRTIINYEQGGTIPESRSEMLQNFIDGNIGGSNINITDNSGSIGNVVGGNIIQVSLPEKGSQKIIKPDGTVVIEHIATNTNVDCSDKEASERNYNIQELLLKIDMQESLILSLKDTIKAQQQTIEMYKDKLS